MRLENNNEEKQGSKIQEQFTTTMSKPIKP